MRLLDWINKPLLSRDVWAVDLALILALIVVILDVTLWRP
jgi:hypothetical protein